MSIIIEVQELTKSYKNQLAVNGLSFQVREGEILGLLGPNGSGKSTTINCLLALLKYQSGSIRIFGQMNLSAYQLKQDIGVVFQEVAVFEELSVYDNVDYFCGLYIKDKKTRKAYLEDALALVGLEDYKKFLPKQLSGGLLRRLNIACGIAHKPKLIFLDEPTVAVDPQSRNHILEGIKKLRELGATIVYTTHYMEEVEILCDRIMILDKGQLIASGTTEELKSLASIEEKIYVEAGHLDKNIADAIKGLPHVAEVELTPEQLRVSYNGGEQNLAQIMDFFTKSGIKYHKIFSERPTLNDVFLELTGKELV